MTLGMLLTQYIESLAGRPSQRSYQQLVRQFFATPDWADRPATAVTRYDILLLSQSLAATPSHANKVLGLVRQAYVWASNTIDPVARAPLYAGENPAASVRRHQTKSREVLMDFTQLGRLVSSLDFLDRKYYVFFLLRLLAPGRITELCQMRWTEVDLTVGRWVKPKTKNGRQHVVPLPTQARLALQAFATVCLDPYTQTLPEYVFQGHYGKPLQPGSARKIWSVFRRDLKLEDIWLLDFRRTLASYVYMTQKGDDMLVKAILNHYDSRPCAVYTRLSTDYLAPIMQGYADWVWGFKREAPGDALPLAAAHIVPGRFAGVHEAAQ